MDVLTAEQSGQSKWGLKLREAKPGVFQTGGVSHFFRERSRLCRGTLSGLFPVGAVNRPRKEEKAKSGQSPKTPQTNRENPGKIGKVPKTTKKDKKGRTSPDQEPPPV